MVSSLDENEKLQPDWGKNCKITGLSYEGILKAWRNWPGLFVQHQCLEFGHFCLPVLPVLPVAKSAWRSWQASTEQATFACRQAKCTC